MPYWTEGGNILCWWRKQGRKRKLAQILREYNQERINNKTKLTLLIQAQDQILQEYCMPIMFARFVYALLVLSVSEFPENLKNPWKFISDRTLYVSVFFSL